MISLASFSKLLFCQTLIFHNQVQTVSLMSFGKMSQFIKSARTKLHSPNGLNNNNLFLRFLEVQKSKRKTQADSVCLQPASQFVDGCLLIVSSHGGGPRSCLEDLGVRTLISSLRSPHYDLVTSKRPRVLLSSNWGVEFNVQSMYLEGDTIFNLQQSPIAFLTWLLNLIFLLKGTFSHKYSKNLLPQFSAQVEMPNRSLLHHLTTPKSIYLFIT